jgi:hypothetical protein
MAEYSRIAKGNVTTLAAGGTAPINLLFQPTSVKWWNYTAMTTPTSAFVASGYWDVSMGQGSSIQNVFNATPVLTTSLATTGGISTFAAGSLLQYGPRQQIIGATKANPVVFNVTAHGYAVGDVVVFSGLYQSATTGMPQLSNIPFVISAVGDANHFSVVWDATGSNYTALSGSPTGAYVKKVLYPYLYEPGVAFIEAVTTGTTTTIVTTAPHNFVVGQEIAFRIPAAWGPVELNSLPNLLVPAKPRYAYVLSLTNNTTFVCSFNSTGYTAYTANQTVASVPGLSPPQVLAVGDVNTGGLQISAGSNLYPSPVFPTSSGGASTINGPAIQGSYVNNTSQGFLFGTTAAPTASQVIYYEALLHDYAVN